jgi:hypothetical protein
MKFGSKLLPFLLLGGLRLSHGQDVQEACAAYDMDDDSVRRDLLAVTGGAIISSGALTLGINDLGHLNIFDTTLPDSLGTVGLRYSGAEALANGCLCEGWGASATNTLTGGSFSGYANRAPTDGSGTANLSAPSIVVTDAATKALTVATVLTGPLRVSHYFEPSPDTEKLYCITVTYENISPIGETLTDLRYRRVMDWDIPPTEFSECVSIDVGDATCLEYTNDNGFSSANPLSATFPLLFECPLGVGCPVFGSGPWDHGALFTLLFRNDDGSLVTLAPNEKFEFKIYYGGAPDKRAAYGALVAVGAEVSRVKISAQ